MVHLDDDTIALTALGEPLDSDLGTHLTQCDACRAEIDSFQHIVTICRSAAGPQLMQTPPPAVWAGILRETAAPTPVQLDEVRTRRMPSRALLVAASVAALGAGVAGTLVWSSIADGDDEVLAEVTLQALPDHTGSGRGEVVRSEDGRELQLTLDAAVPADAFLQVWLLSSDATRMVPVGVLTDGTGHWALPTGVTFADYPLVDVSIEPYDGDPLHSTNSLVRGTIDAGTASATASRDGISD